MSPIPAGEELTPVIVRSIGDGGGRTLSAYDQGPDVGTRLGAQFTLQSIAPMALLGGNLLPESMQSMTSTNNWTVTGATAQINPDTTITYPEVDPIGGMVCTADGAVPLVLESTDTYPVESGLEYVAWVWYVGTDRTGTLTVEIQWLDDTDTEVLLSSTDWPDLPTLAHTNRASCAATCPEGATQARFRVTVSQAASGDLTLWDGAYLGRPAPWSHLDFADYSSEHELADWAISGPASLDRGRTEIGYLDGGWAAQATPTGVGTISLTLGTQLPVEPGATYAVRTKVAAKTDNDPTGSVVCRSIITYYDADDSPLPPGHETPYGEYADDAFWLSLTSTRTLPAPANAAYARVGVDIIHDAYNGTAMYQVDMVQFWEATPAYVLSVYDSAGYVELELNFEVDAGFAAWGVYRVDEDGTESPVRGYGQDMDRIPWTGPGQYVIEDYEAPVGSRIHYVVRWFDAADDSRPSTWTTTHSVRAPDIADTSYVWLKSPGLPAMNVMAMMAEALAWSMPSNSVAIPIVGRSTPVVISQIRSSRQGSIFVRTESPDQNEAFRALLMLGQPLLLQAAPGHGVDGNLYLSVGNVSYVPDNWRATAHGWLWTLEVVEIDRPLGGVQGSSGRTWADVSEEFNTWDEVHAAYPAWSAVLTGG